MSVLIFVLVILVGLLICGGVWWLLSQTTLSPNMRVVMMIVAVIIIAIVLIELAPHIPHA